MAKKDTFNNTTEENTTASAQDPQPSGLSGIITKLLHAEITKEVRRIIQEEYLPKLDQLILEMKAERQNQVSQEVIRQIVREELKLGLESSIDRAKPAEETTGEVLPQTSNQPKKSKPAGGIRATSVPVSSEKPGDGSPQTVHRPQRQKPMDPKNIRLGIDFGTTTTAISVRLNDERPVAVPIGKDGVTRYIPSVVYINPGSQELNERILVGEEADGMADEMKKIRSVKRCLDCNGKSCSLSGKPEGADKFPWCSGTGKILIGGSEEVEPAKIAYFIIREALVRAMRWMRDTQGLDVTMETIKTIPVNFGCGAKFSLSQRKILVKIARDFGFNDFTINNIVEEPVLAGFTFSRFAKKAGGYSLIYDFGGGTLDVAVVDTSYVEGKPQITVLATSAESWLGGDDIDQLVYAEFLRQAAASENKTGEEFEAELTPADKSRLRQVARRAKELLSDADNFEDAFLSEKRGYLDLHLSLQTFETLLENSGLIDKSLNATLKALKLTASLKCASENDLFDTSVFRISLKDAAPLVKQVVLVGGVTKIPYVRRKMANLFGKASIVEQTVIEPISAVAIGASYPKEAHHFSISAPPLGFILSYKESDKTDAPVKNIVLQEPFAEYEFYSSIHSISIAQHQISFSTQNDYLGASIQVKNLQDNKLTELFNIGRLAADLYDLYIGLDGIAHWQKKNRKPSSGANLPLRHPAQILIEENRKRRVESQRVNDKRTYEESIRDMMSEN